MATIFVDAAAVGANNGTSWTNAYTALQSALAAVTSDDDIWVAAGTYKPTNEVGGAGDGYKTFQMVNSVGIYGGFVGTETALAERDWLANETILSGDIGATDSYHVLYHPSGTNLDATAILDGFTISDGYAAGGGVHDNGAGIYNDGCDPTIRNCDITSNYAAGAGAGIYNTASNPDVINCSINNNTADGTDGAVSNNLASAPTFTGGEIVDNIAPAVGGVANRGSSITTLINCTVTGNTAASSAASGAGGVYNATDSELDIDNCIIRYNTNASDTGYNDIHNDGAGTIEISHSCYSAVAADVDKGSDWTENDCINGGPVFTSSATGDYTIAIGSPCIDAGDSDAVPAGVTTDVANLYRFSGDACDMGAHEYQYTITLSYTAGDNGSLTGYTDQTVNYNGSGTAVTAAEDAGYSFVAWSDGKTDNPRTDAAVTLPVAVTALFVADAITVEELQLSREMQEDNTASLLYSITGSTDSGDVINAVNAAAPATFEGLYRGYITVTPVVIDTDTPANSTWKAEVAYKAANYSPPKTGESVFTFDTTGGSQHVQQAIETISTVGDKAKHNGAINFDGETVNGIDIVSPKYGFTETHYLETSIVTDSYKHQIFWLTGTVNNGTFKGYAAGEVLFLGARGSQRSNEDWEITFSFACAPSVENFNIPELGNVSKKGWEYLSVRYDPNAETNGIGVKPIQADVFKVYQERNFGLLGIGT